MWKGFVIFYNAFIRENHSDCKEFAIVIMVKRDVSKYVVIKKKRSGQKEGKYRSFTEDGKKREKTIITRVHLKSCRYMHIAMWNSQ